MSRTTIARATQSRIAGWVLGATCITACSLTVPSESSLFGDAAGHSGAATAGGGGALNSGGTVEEGGKPNGGAPDNGAGSGGKPAGGSASGGTSGHAPAEAGSGGDAAGAAGEPNVVTLPSAVLLLHYDFDDLSQQLAKDSSGAHKDGTLAGLSLPVAAVGHIGGALKLDGTQKQYVQLPNDILDGHDGISITAWLELSQAFAWDRLFDFNSGESNWFYFSPTGWNDTTKTFGTRCATRNSTTLAPEIEMTQTIPIDEWHHIAIVFAQPYLRYYLDGMLQSEQTDLSFGPASLGKTNQNWIGRSVYAADPYLSGMVDDFRVYSGALTETEIATLAAQ